MRVGIMGSEWIGLDNFKRLFSSYWFPIILKNTLTLSLLSLILGFPLPIILALLLNEVSNGHFRKCAAFYFNGCYVWYADTVSESDFRYL